MITAILIVLLLLLFAAMGFIYVIFVHLTLKKEYEDKHWMDNDEFDYGHDIKHYNETNNFLIIQIWQSSKKKELLLS